MKQRQIVLEFTAKFYIFLTSRFPTASVQSLQTVEAQDFTSFQLHSFLNDGFPDRDDAYGACSLLPFCQVGPPAEYYAVAFRIRLLHRTHLD